VHETRRDDGQSRGRDQARTDAHVRAIRSSPDATDVVTLQTLIDAYLQEYEVREFRINIARCRVAHLRAHFGDTTLASDITMYGIRQYQVARRQHGAASATINRETSALNRMFRLVTSSWPCRKAGNMTGAVRLGIDQRRNSTLPSARVGVGAELHDSADSGILILVAENLLDLRERVLTAAVARCDPLHFVGIV